MGNVDASKFLSLLQIGDRPSVVLCLLPENVCFLSHTSIFIIYALITKLNNFMSSLALLYPAEDYGHNPWNHTYLDAYTHGQGVIDKLLCEIEDQQVQDFKTRQGKE